MVKEPDGSVPTLRPGGSVVSSGSRRFIDDVLLLLASGARDVLVDMREVSFISKGAVTGLVEISDGLAAEDGMLGLVNVRGVVRNLISLRRAGRNLRIFENESEAREVFARRAAEDVAGRDAAEREASGVEDDPGRTEATPPQSDDELPRLDAAPAPEAVAAATAALRALAEEEHHERVDDPVDDGEEFLQEFEVEDRAESEVTATELERQALADREEAALVADAAALAAEAAGAWAPPPPVEEPHPMDVLAISLPGDDEHRALHEDYADAVESREESVPVIFEPVEAVEELPVDTGEVTPLRDLALVGLRESESESEPETAGVFDSLVDALLAEPEKEPEEEPEPQAVPGLVPSAELPTLAADEVPVPQVAPAAELLGLSDEQLSRLMKQGLTASRPPDEAPPPPAPRRRLPEAPVEAFPESSEIPVRPEPSPEPLPSTDDVDTLLRRLRSDDPRVRWHAARGLGRLGNPRALEPLRAVAGRDGEYRFVREMACVALRRLGHRDR